MLGRWAALLTGSATPKLGGLPPMTRKGRSTKVVRIVLTLALTLAALSAFSPQKLHARESMHSMDRMVTQAKTPADHEKLAKMYDAEAAKARASAEMHHKMAEAYRK